MTKTWTRDEINQLLTASNRAVERGIVRLNTLQTRDERQAQSTLHHNNVGFASYAARSGTYYANWVNRGRRLTGKHLNKARKICLKHSRQLVAVANGTL
jgi:hypothetical protein|tara:strand:- start:1910 stop:2206 length:297 start_codon:yes stop_codon:yes gene_type:complete